MCADIAGLAAGVYHFVPAQNTLTQLRQGDFRGNWRIRIAMRQAPQKGQEWQARSYAHHARFVADLALPVVDLLAPQKGEQILDLGCGDAALTREIVQSMIGNGYRDCDFMALLELEAKAAGLDLKPENIDIDDGLSG